MRNVFLFLLFKFTLVDAQTDTNSLCYINEDYKITSTYHHILIEDSLLLEKYTGYISFTLDLDTLFNVSDWKVDVFRLFARNNEDTIINYMSSKNEGDVEVVLQYNQYWQKFIKSLIIKHQDNKIITRRTQVFVKVIAIPNID